ncbi:hypothetical protein ElyMa_001188500 [Elysia marginata]|uniref:Chitin-binding type-4 domain-containing protein n=1 Tax=Elysia marginata TaxID=1093978 RepID=A0AAV4I515_9GAST|nr:hypothetical protein ElyMa_001188500 [Elysia marginata]
MCVNSLSQGIKVDLPKAGLEPRTSRSESRASTTTPRRHTSLSSCGLQWDTNKGRCGICGDPWSGPRPYERPGGAMVKDLVITKTYLENQSIKVSIQLTQNHKGWFEFRLCDVRTSGGQEADQACLDRTMLADDTGRTRFDSPPDSSGTFDFILVLPPGLTCPQCVLQWKWKCGNNWGCDETGCATGKGERQEEFYACADPISPQPRPQPSHPIGERPELPQGFSSYTEYLHNMFAKTTNNALKYTNKIRVPTGGVGKRPDPIKEQFDRQFLRDVVGYPARQQSFPQPGRPIQLPSWLHRQPLVDQDSVDRLCAACQYGCQFSACGWHCSRQCRP